MKNWFTLVVALFIVGFVFGCNSSGETKVRKGRGVPGPTGAVEVSKEEAALIQRGLQGNNAAVEAATKELRKEAAAGKKEVVAASSPKKVGCIPVEKAGSLAPPADASSEQADKPADGETQSAEDKKVEENTVPPKDKKAKVEKKRCRVCDDVSDTVQCLTCWGYHKKSAEHLAPPEGKTMCPQCHNEHEFKAGHRQPPTVVVYDQNTPCAACREVHSAGPHCLHCSKAATENKPTKESE